MIKDKFDLTGKVALVVGGRGFLGRRLANALSEFGAQVYAADLPDLSLAARSDSTTTPTQPLSKVIQLDVDVTNEESVRTLVSDVTLESSRIDILVYAATSKPKDFYKPFTECGLEGWQTVLRVELDGLFLVAREVGRLMETARGGSIILLSSIYGIVGNDQRIYAGSNLPNLYAGVESIKGQRTYSHAVYAAVKGGVISIARYLAAYWGEYGVRVNCISPGGLAHPGENDEFVRRYTEHVPLGRKANVDEVSGAVVYLASDASSYVTGHNLVVDGGWTSW
jgi:NAD(P)-dependent dehydrogenase (short-subunit alcohol dehydrogenase family)